MLTPEALRRLNHVREGLIETSQIYEGTSIFAPSKNELARVMGVGVQVLNADNTSYVQKIRAVTGGMEQIHRGVVLGDPTSVKPLTKDSLPEITDPVDIETLADIINSLPETERKLLIGRVAIPPQE